MKRSKDGMPTWDALIPFVLEYLIENGSEVERREIRQDVADNLGLTPELRNKIYKSDYADNVIENRIDFAISSLKISGLIENVSRGVFRATDLGKSYFSEYRFDLTKEIVDNTPPALEYAKNKEEKDQPIISEVEEDRGSFESMEAIDDMINESQQRTRDELLAIILKSSPYLFESIVEKLLSKMGYKGKDGKSIVTPKSHDGGIDGFIHHDPLGTQTVYIQAKRYSENNKVTRPEIQAFYGALSSISATRGVLITTSYFTSGAIEDAKKLSIILVDRDQLLDLLIEYEIGIEKYRTYNTYKIDEEFFENN